MMTDAFSAVDTDRAAPGGPMPPHLVEDAANTGTTSAAVWTVAALCAVITGMWLARRHGRTAITRARSAWSTWSARRADARADVPPTPTALPARNNASAPGAAERPMTLKRAALGLILVTVLVDVSVMAFALALNFDHGRELAELNGELGWRSKIWPLTTDGLLIAASLVGLVRQLLGLSIGFRAHAAFISGITASVATNVILSLHTQFDSGWALAENIYAKSLPTLVLLFTHSMALGLIAYFLRTFDAFGVEGPNPALVAAEAAQQHAEDEARAARLLVDEQRAAHQREITKLRADLARIEQAAETDHARAERTITELRANLDEAGEQLGALDDELERLRSAEQQRSAAPAKRSAEEWEQLRQDAQEWAREYVREYGEIPTGPMVAAQVIASDRWANNVLKSCMDELLDLRNAMRGEEHQDDEQVSAEVRAEDVVSVG